MNQEMHESRAVVNIQRTSLDNEEVRCKTTSKRSNGVSFAAVASTRHTISWRDFSAAETRATWYNQDEYIYFQRRCCKEIIKIENGEKLRDKKYCSRGLECHTRYGRITKSKNRSQSIQVVLEAQNSKVRDGHPYDSEAIARAYHGATSSCQLWAAATGLADARASEEDDDIAAIDDCTTKDDDLGTVVKTPSSRNCKHYMHRTAYSVSSSPRGRGGQELPPPSCFALLAARSA